MLCGSWLRETTLGFTFFFSSLRLLDISYFCLFPTSTWLDWMMYDAPTNPYCIQVKLVGRREERMKAKVKRGTAAGNLDGSVKLCGVMCHFKRCEKITYRYTTYKIWLWRKQWSSKLTTFVCKQIHRSSLLPEELLSRLIINSVPCVRESIFFPHPPPYLVLLVYASLGGFQKRSEDG